MAVDRRLLVAYVQRHHKPAPKRKTKHHTAQALIAQYAQRPGTNGN